MPSFLQSLSRNLFGFDRSESFGDRLHFRIVELFLVAYTLQFCWEWGFYIQENISSVLLPLGIAHYVDISFMFEHYVAVVNAGLVTLLCGAGFLRLWRPAYVMALLLFHLQYVSRYCLGAIAHGPNMVGMGLLSLGLAGLFYSEARHRRRFTVGALYFFIGLGYTTAGMCKLIGTGVTWPDGHHLLLWIAERQVDAISKLGTFDPTFIQDLVLTDYRLGTLFLLFGLLVELSSILVWWRRFRYVVMMLLVVLHVGFVLSLDIFFDATTYLFLLLALPWGAGIDYVVARLPSSPSPPLRIFARQ